MRFRYLYIKEICFLEDYGYYRSFSILCWKEGVTGRRFITKLSDVSTNQACVSGLVRLLTRMQLRPVHLQDAVLNVLP